MARVRAMSKKAEGCEGIMGAALLALKPTVGLYEARHTM